MVMFEDFRGFEHLYDARVRTEDSHEFPVHRVLLAIRSEYFRRLFCDSPAEQTDFFVPEIQGSTLERILEYIYTGKLNFNENNIKDIIVAADFFGIEKLLNDAKDIAIRHLTIENSIPLLLEGIKNNRLGILKASSRFIVVNFELITRDYNSRLEDLTGEYLKHLLSSDSLNVLSERLVWMAIQRWISKFPEERKSYLKYLIPCIRYDDADSDLYLEVQENTLVKENLSHADLEEFQSIQRIAPNYRLPKALYFFTKSFVSRSDYAEGIKIFITYDENIDIWRNIGSKIFCPDVVFHGSGSLIVMFEAKKNVICTYDVLSKAWSTLNPPNIPRWNYNMLKLGNHIYAMGGVLQGGEVNQNVTMLERYNFDSERWEIVASHHAITESVAVTVDNKIYGVGVPDFFSEVMSAQVYDPDINVWRTIQAPKLYRRLFALAAYNKQLFILGGQNNEAYLTSVEVYDANKDIWEDFENLPFAYFLPKAVTINSKLYVYDNFPNEMYDFRCPAVLWDETHLKWQVVEASSPFSDLQIYQFCTIEDSEVIKEMKKENRGIDTKWVESPFFIHLNS